MTLTFTYRSPLTPAGPAWTEDLGQEAVRLGELGIATSAELGAVSVSGLRVDDPEGNVGHAGDAIVGLKQLSITESAAPAGNRRVWEGYIGPRTYSRGRDSFRVGAARLIDITIVDLNSFLSHRRFTSKKLDATSSFVRPKETDLERVAALLAVDFLSTTLFDNGLVSSSDPVNMDAVDYSTQTPNDVLNDCAQQSGRNFFVYYDEGAGQFSLFYDFNVSMVYLTTVRVSNVRADVDNVTTFYGGRGATLTRDPGRVMAGVLMPYDGGMTYRNSLPTSYQFGYRDFLAPSENVKSLAKANARSDRYLDENATEDDRLTWSMTVPKANVNDWKEGQAGQVRFSHLPDYEGFRYVRALSRTVRQSLRTPELYTIEYEGTPMGEPTEEELLFGDDLLTFDGDQLTFGG